jgi:hypothetical protein
MEGLTRLVVRVEAADRDDMDGAEDDMVDAARQLRRELLDHDVESAELLTADDAPPGAKSGTGLTFATIAISMMSAGIPPLVSSLHAWAVNRRPRCTLHIEGPDGRSIEIPNLSMERAHEVMLSWTGPQRPT